MAQEQCDYNVGIIAESHIILKYTAHDILVLVAAISTGLALLLSFGQIVFHATHYHIPEQQRRINRLLFMIPVYSVSNLLAAKYITKAIYFELVGNAYAAIGLASFFNLLYAYVTEGAQDPKQYFRRLKLKHWQWPLSWFRRGKGGREFLIRTPRNGLTWFNICYCGVFQYNFVLLATCIAGSIANVFDRYCPASLRPTHAYIWILIINAISATVSSYCLTQFHRQVRHDLDKHRADFQFLCIQIVLYLSTYQKLLITLLLRHNWIHVTDRLSALDIRVSLPSALLCAEMVLVSLLHLYAYPLRPYRVWHRPRALHNYVVSTPHTYTGVGLGAIAMMEMLNPWDLVTGIGRAFKYMIYDMRRRHHDIGYANQHINQIADPRSTWDRRASLFPPSVVAATMTVPQVETVNAADMADEKADGTKARKKRTTILSSESNKENKPVAFMSDAGSIVMSPSGFGSDADADAAANADRVTHSSISIIQTPPRVLFTNKNRYN